jgi:hypothetical protein
MLRMLLTRACPVLIADIKGWLDFLCIDFLLSVLAGHAMESRFALAMMDDAFAGRSGTWIGEASDARKAECTLDDESRFADRGGGGGGRGSATGDRGRASCVNGL